MPLYRMDSFGELGRWRATARELVSTMVAMRLKMNLLIRSGHLVAGSASDSQKSRMCQTRGTEASRAARVA